MPLKLLLFIAALGLLAGCSLYKSEAFVPENTDDCVQRIRLPSSFLDANPTTRAQVHEDVYGDDPAPFQLRYQWPSRDPSTSASFLWRTDLGTLATLVELTDPQGKVMRVEGATLVYGAYEENPGYRIHETRICSGLTPATTYTYRVGGEQAWSPQYSFTTPGPPHSFDTFRVAMLGDSRGSYTTWAAIIEAAETHDPDFYMFSGDMIEFGTLQDEWDTWFEAAGDLWTSKNLVPAHGNHEFLVEHYFANFSLPGNEEWFSHDYGNLHLTVLNDTVRNFGADVAGAQAVFLDDDLSSAADTDWTLAMHHRAMYSASGRHGSYTDLREVWAPIFDQHQLDLVVAGHNHLYERSVPIRNDMEAAPGQGTTYLVTGGAGGPLYDEIDESWFNEVYNVIEHYIIADFGPTGADLVVRDLEGNVIDEFSLTK